MQTTVWVTSDVLAYCWDEASRAFPNETGGVLMGWHRPERQEVVVVHAVGPGPGGIHQPHRFEPDNDHHVATVGEVYQRSGRKVTYLGDWHTHPGGLPTPSRTDLRTLSRIAEDEPSRCPEPITLILAGDATGGWMARVHAWAPRRWLCLWERPWSETLLLRGWRPAPEELDAIGYPYRS